jgi:hypothetical protein
MSSRVGLGSRMVLVGAFAVMMMATTIARAELDLDIVVNAMPATLLIDTDGKKFATESQDGRVSLDEVYTMPNIAIGVGTVWKAIYVDLVGGAGVIINSGFRSFMLQAILEGGVQVSNSLNVGPRIGIIHFPDPEWLENDDVSFDSDTGFLAGVQLSMGDKIKYMVSVDWIDATFNVTPGTAVTTENDLSLSALAIQFGVRGEF